MWRTVGNFLLAKSLKRRAMSSFCGAVSEYRFFADKTASAMSFVIVNNIQSVSISEASFSTCNSTSYEILSATFVPLSIGSDGTR